MEKDKNGRVKVTINLPQELVKAAKIEAIQRDIDFQDLVAEAIRRAVKGSAR
jgi:predicted DNA binding CopG/RHH family protein